MTPSDTHPSLPTDMVETAAQAYERFRYAVDNDLLMQRGWHAERDGRHIACMLGALGGKVTSSDACPAQIMPRWLARLIPNMFDAMPFDQAKIWGLGVYEQLARLDGKVPFSVVYDWQATCVLDFWAGSLQRRKFDAETMAAKLAAVEKLRGFHRTHLAGGAVPKAEWLEVLRQVYRAAYAYADADAYAYAYAYADADAYADAYAYAYADAYAYAYAYAYADAYADAYAEPTPKASAHETPLQKRERRRAENLTLLANGLVEAMSRAPATDAAS